jgi:Molybdopterin oxidoreductase
MSKKPRIEEYHHEPAGGWGDALATAAIVREQGVLLKSGAAPFFMPGGFNCPSCAWPDSPPHSDPLVFCENRAKVLAWESTKMRATPLLSRRITVRCRTTSHECSTSTSWKVIRRDSKRFGTICATLRGPQLRDSPRLHKLNLQKPLRVYFEANRVIVCYGMGITQHIRGTQNVQQLINLLLLRGNIGRPGAGICPAEPLQRAGRSRHRCHGAPDQ